MNRRVVGLAILLAAGAAAAKSSTFLALSQEELLAGSTAVLQGRVVEVESFWNAERTAILSEALVSVDEVLVGRAPTLVRVRTFGGTVGGYTVEAQGFPRFVAGEEALLFLYREPADGSVRVWGYQQGQYRIETRGGERIAVPAIGRGVRLLGADGVEIEAALPLPLSELRRRVLELGQRLGRRAN
jgi:hypothetical protein